MGDFERRKIEEIDEKSEESNLRTPPGNGASSREKTTEDSSPRESDRSGESSWALKPKHASRAWEVVLTRLLRRSSVRLSADSAEQR